MFLQGLILGFSVAAPVGPIGLLCIQRTLEHGRLHGFVSGIGAASADAVYGTVAALGLSAVTAFLIGLQSWLQLGGGAFLLWFGLRTALTRPGSRTAGAADSRGLTGAYVSVLLLTLANPATMLAFVAVFAGLGVGAQFGGHSSALLLVIGVFVGSAAWWLILSLISGMLRHRLTPRAMRTVNVISGACIIVLGFWSLWPVIRTKLT